MQPYGKFHWKDRQSGPKLELEIALATCKFITEYNGKRKISSYTE